MFDGIVTTLGSVLVTYALVFFLIRILRRRAKPTVIVRSPAFDLVELQTLRDTGKITPEEFERLRLIVLSQATPDEQVGTKGFDVLPPK